MKNRETDMRLNPIRRAGLAGAALAAALLLGACAEAPAPPFTIEGTGALEGFLFLDANEDGIFDPSAGDRPIEGVRVVALSRATQQALPGGTAITDATGRFTFEALPPGTHDLLFNVEDLPEEGVNVCRNPVPATVFLNERQFTQVAARPACLISITEAKEQSLGDFVIVRGIVTSFPGQLRSGYTFIQDEDTGILLFESGLEGRDIEIGDLIEVGGTLAEFGRNFQLTGVTLREHIEDVEDPVAEPVTTAEIAVAGPDARAPIGGRLVRVSGARLTRGFTSGGDRNALIDDGTGVVELRIEGALSESGDQTIRSTLGLEIGNCYDIVGVVGAFGGVAQLFPLSADHIEEVPCS